MVRKLLPPGDGRSRCTLKFACPACDRNRANDTGAYYRVDAFLTTSLGPPIRGSAMLAPDGFPPWRCRAAACALQKYNSFDR